MDPISLEAVLRALPGGASLIGSSALATRFTGISTDSRTVAPGELFVAIPGERFDGNLYVKAALERGAAGAIAREDCPFQTLPGRPIVVVRDPVRALGAIACEVRRGLRAKVVAITGSCGKTTTRELLRQLLEPSLRTVAAEKSHNNAIGVPLTIFKADRETEALVLEVGTSGPGEIAALARIALPDVAVVTNVGPAHLERLGDEDGVAREKGALVERVREGGAAVLNADDARVRDMAARVPLGRRICWFGEAGEDALLGGVALPFEGRHVRLDALAALTAAQALGLEPRAIARRLETAKLPGRRLERRALAGGIALLDDAYNANPASTAAALEVLAGAPGRRVFVFGGMRELGPTSAEHHRAIGARAAKAGVALLAAVGDDASLAADGAVEAGLPRDQALRFEAPEAAADALAGRLSAGDVVLVKGSRGAELERFIERLAMLRPPAVAAA
jgi:UDP-N-acetylmuramoyl-tripeptide--D-alanyl-D-alanine ligase